MRRISHDLPGVAQRLSKLSDHLEMRVGETQEAWKDQKGRQFLQKHFADVRPVTGQVVTGLAQTIELFEEISRRLRDPDYN
ncbi:MAG: hypothetical protein AB8B50_05130 [Pirellulaceae bacterium]